MDQARSEYHRQVTTAASCLPEKNGRSAATRSVWISVPSITAKGCPALTAARTAWRSFGARAALANCRLITRARTLAFALGQSAGHHVGLAGEADPVPARALGLVQRPVR